MNTNGHSTRLLMKDPSRLKLIFSMGALVLILARDLPEDMAKGQWGFGIVKTAFLLMAGGIILYSIIRLLKRPEDLVIEGDRLLLRGKVLGAGEIGEVRIQGSYRPEIGIVPWGRRIVPIACCFRFAEPQKDEAMQSFLQWAQQHRVNIANRRFRRWI
ncbi:MULTISPECIES: hypothetical protein [Paenibacillus]|uniref:hypothetical protein n=1 Tax=Paenibacillus TaxID=44249 RepID=UPI0022B86589|nr:hypothetical protein [Paenibacillus caseinilyticus]MCZ8521807.1 hypothetical protein [Paenibacillus caseinilyticus]